MKKFEKDWNQYTLTIDNITLQWRDVETLAWFSTLQSGMFGVPGRDFSKQIFFEEFKPFYEKMWNLNKFLDITYKGNENILDVGSGVSIIDLLLAKKYPELNFTLLDKEEVNMQPDIFYSNEYFFYNSWKPVVDCIETTNIEKSRFNFITNTDKWPEDLDMITSYFSWCMHYPKETYWDNLKDSLKKNGKLILDVRNLDDRDVVSEITEEFKCKPKVFAFKNTTPEWIDNYGNDTLGWRCVWVKG